MAVVAQAKRIEWEVRTTGDVANGAGYLDLGGSDYSQQNVAQLTITDLTCFQGRTKIYTANGGFTGPMIGNFIKVSSGSNFTAGYYLILSVLSTNYAIVDRTPCPAGDGSGGNAKVGGGAAEISDVDSELGPNHILWVKSGTYNNHPSFTTPAGTSSNDPGKIQVIGYDSSRGDNPTGANRPLITDTDVSSMVYTFGIYNDPSNLRFEITSGSTTPIRLNHGKMENCDLLLNRTLVPGGLFYCLFIQGGGNIVRHCRFRNSGITNTRGVDIANCNGGKFEHCFFGGGLDNGIWGLPLNAPTVESCLFYGTIGYAIRGNADILSNVFYYCGVSNNEAAFYTDTLCQLAVNNIFEGCYRAMNGASWGTIYSKGNHYHNTGANAGRVIEYSSTSGDPLFTNPGALDFSLQVGSPCRGAGFGMRLAM